MKKMFKYLLFSIILFSFSTIVKAESFTPTNTLEVWTSSSSARATGVLHYFQNGLDLYESNLYHSETYSFFGLYGVTNNSVVGNYFSFFVETSAPSYTSIMQLSDGSYVNCDVSSSIVADGANIVAFTCSLPINATVYKYGVSIPNGVPGPNVKISKLTYFMNATASQINDIQNSITSVFNNISNVANNVKDVENAVKDTNDTIKDGSVDSAGITALTETKLPTSGIFSAILNLPVQFFQSLLDNLSTTTCKNIEFTLPYVDQDVSIPCVRKLLEQLNALAFYETIGGLVGGIAIFNYLMYMGKQFTKMELLQHTNAEFGGL